MLAEENLASIAPVAELKTPEYEYQHEDFGTGSADAEPETKAAAEEPIEEIAVLNFVG